MAARWSSAARAPTFRSPAEARQAGIVSVYQDPALVPDLTVAQNVRLAASAPMPCANGWSNLGIAELDLDEFVRDLALSRPAPDRSCAGAWRPSRPSCCSTRSPRRCRPICRSASSGSCGTGASAATAVIFISHRMAEVSALCDRATVLRDGVTVGVTDTAPRQRGAHRRADAWARSGRHAAAAGSTRLAAETAAPPVAPALEVRDLRCGRLLNDVSFALHAGEVLGVAALEGSGPGGIVRLHRRRPRARRRRDRRAMARR